MNKMVKTVSALLATISVVGLIGCGGGKTEGTADNNLTIRFYKGGFGDAWLETAKNDFIAKKAESGETITVELIPDATIQENATQFLASGKNLPDIMMTQGNDWTNMVNNGYLAPLKETFEAEVTKLDGSTVKVKDYLKTEIKEMPYMQIAPGQGEYLPWVMPWSILETSIVYNEDMLLNTVHTTSRNGYNVGEKWTSAPKTMQELSDYCVDIIAANANKSDADKVYPMGWGGADAMNYHQFIIYALWAQQQGVDTSLISGEGSWYDFWNFESSDVWKQTGIQKAIDDWREIVVDTSSQQWKNCIPNVQQITKDESAVKFCNQKVAMILSGSFFENEYKDFLDLNGDGKDDFAYKMMYVPTTNNPDHVKTSDGADAKINFCSSDDIMFIPAGAANIDLAKEFLAFLCNEKYLLDFSKQTGCVRPFEYDPVALTKDDSSVTWSPFFLSTYTMMKDADYNLYTYPKNAEDVSMIYTYKRPSLFQGAGISGSLQELLRSNGKTIMIDGTDTFSSVYTRANKDYNDWVYDFGL